MLGRRKTEEYMCGMKKRYFVRRLKNCPSRMPNVHVGHEEKIEEMI